MEIYEDQANQSTKKHNVDKEGRFKIKLVVNQPETDRGDDFHQWVNGAYRRFTFPAFTLQNQVAEHRYIFPGRNQVTAFWTPGARRDHRFPFWDPVDTDIQEASDYQAQ